MSSPPVPSVREAIAEGGASARCVAAFRFLIARLHGEHAAASWAGDDERTALWVIDADRHRGGQRWLHQVRREHAQKAGLRHRSAHALARADISCR